MRTTVTILLLAGFGALVGSACSLGPTTDGDSPALIITAPSTDSVSGAVPFSASAADPSGIARVKFFVDDVLLADDLTTPYATVWNTTPAIQGPHELKVEATDGVGNTTSLTKVVVVIEGRQ